MPLGLCRCRNLEVPDGSWSWPWSPVAWCGGCGMAAGCRRPSAACVLAGWAPFLPWGWFGVKGGVFCPSSVGGVHVPWRRRWGALRFWGGGLDGGRRGARGGELTAQVWAGCHGRVGGMVAGARRSVRVVRQLSLRPVAPHCGGGFACWGSSPCLVVARPMAAASMDVVSFMKASSRLLSVLRVALSEDLDPLDRAAATLRCHSPS